MSINKTYGVFGLGRYGKAVALELVNSGAEVLAVDINEETVNSAATELPYCKCADVTDPEAIKLLGAGELDVVIIAMSQSFEASVMATMLCKQAGVGTVIVKSSDDMHSEILRRVGADRVVTPETESGRRLAKNLLSSGFVDIIELSTDFSLIELEIKDEWVGKNLIELNLRKKYGINVVALRQKDSINCSIDPSEPLTADISLVVIAEGKKLSRLL